METKLYVGNLSYATTEETLHSLFSQTGNVLSVELIKDRYTGQSKGFAFIEMGAQTETEQAISKFNGYSLDDRQIKVSIAKPREPRPSGGWYTDSPPRNTGYNKSTNPKNKKSTRRY